jgi:WD40 repeat protein
VVGSLDVAAATTLVAPAAPTAPLIAISQAGPIAHRLDPPPEFARLLRGGNRLMSAAADGSFRVVDVATGHTAHTFFGPPDPVVSAEIGPHNRFAVTRHRSGAISLWRLDDGIAPQTDRIAEADAGLGRVRFNRDGTRILVSGPAASAGALYDAETGQIVSVLRDGTRGQFRFTLDGARVVTARTSWDARRGEPVCTFTWPATARPRLVAVSDVRVLVTAAGRSAVFDATTCDQLDAADSTAPVRAADFDADGSIAIGHDDGRIEVTETTLAAVRELARLPSAVDQLASAGAGRWVARAGDALVLLGEVGAPIPLSERARDVSVVGAHIIGLGDVATVWSGAGQPLVVLEPRHPDTTGGVIVSRLEADLVAVTMAQDGRLATAASDGSLRVWADDGRLLMQWWGERPARDVAFSPDGQWLVTVHESSIRLWSTAPETRSPDDIVRGLDAQWPTWRRHAARTN